MKLQSLPEIKVPPKPAMREQVNPHLLRPAHKRWNNQRFASGKFYFAILVGPRGEVYRARVFFQRAHHAEFYAKRLKVKWIGLYEAAIKAKPQQQEQA